MRSPRLAQKLPLAIPVILVILLAILASLQYLWSGEVSEMERLRMRGTQRAAGARFSEDFDREVARAFLLFHPVSGEAGDARLNRVVHQYDRWLAEAPWPRLVRDVFLIRRDADGGSGLEVLWPAEHRFVPCSWPPELADLRSHLEAPPPNHPGHAGFGMGPTVAAEVPGLVIPLDFLDHREPGAPRSASGTDLVVRFDLKTIESEILPDLTKHYFSSPQNADYSVGVRVTNDPRRVLYLSDPQMTPASFGDGDLQVGMFNLRPFEELRSLSTESGLTHRRQAPEPPARGSAGPRGISFHDMFGLHAPPPPSQGHHRESGPWQLMIKHRDGSLEEAVAAIRRRNLGISLGILALLGATAGMMFVTTQRAQRLAQQQIEFVAGVTHELNTPLTAIRSAGQNLADGVVADPGQVRRYGALIESEGRRLSDMVGQALDFAGIQSGRRVYHPRPVEIAEVVDGALQDCRWLLREKRIQVDREVEPGLPPVLVDSAALRRAVANLIENAVKYGAKAAWIGVRAQRSGQDSGDNGPVEISVADRGPGIRREDLPHLFEPFFRGPDAATAGVPGSGLGLSLVRHIAESHGGKVTVTTEVGKGTTFTLRLPAATSAAEEMQGMEAPA
ncbi:MAG TPA: HAMP domain-containing sensor histidine kinase [Thermoanaerobaculia bacterium]|nr:HAMP domain-containing sensor histidine kinase [Thermoanaerobaculia bacterium]